MTRKKGSTNKRLHGRHSWSTSISLSIDAINILRKQQNSSEYADRAIIEKGLREDNPHLILDKLRAEKRELAQQIYDVEQQEKEIEEKLRILNESKEKVKTDILINKIGDVK